jgi:hypothetical protein
MSACHKESKAIGLQPDAQGDMDHAIMSPSKEPEVSWRAIIGWKSGKQRPRLPSMWSRGRSRPAFWVD